MESLDVFTQDELDAALGRPDVIPVCAGDARFEVGGDRFVRAADAAHVTLRDAAAVEAGGQATIVAGGRADVTARDLATVELRDAARARAYGRVSVDAGADSRVTAGGEAVVAASGAAAVTAQGLASVTAGDGCSVRALASARVEVLGNARVWAWGGAVVRARDDSTVTAWGSATVHAGGAAQVEALETAVVMAAGPVTVRAFGDAVVRARGRAQVTPAPDPSPSRSAGASAWCEYYGVAVDDGVATLFKAVADDYTTYHGGSYLPGTEPLAPDWDGGERECGAGLHFSPRPTFALMHPDDQARFVACPVRAADIVVHANGLYPDKVKAPGVCAPVYEVHEDGTPVGEPQTEFRG
jgi:hypothetical protein